MNRREALILTVLRDGEKYGLELREAHGRLAGRAMPLGSLYTTLHRMESKGLVRSRQGESESARGGNRRRWFRLTAKGVRGLDQWLLAAHATLRALEGPA